jgi:hypothetical protein
MPVINPYMILTWNEVLPAAMRDLSPKQQEIVSYMTSLPGKQKPSPTYISETWNLTRDEFDAELAAALMTVKEGLKRRGIHRYADLDSL